MSNVILKLKTVEQEEICIAASAIESYISMGHWVVLSTKSRKEYNVATTVEALNNALIESYFMLKPVV